ncbi:MAG: ceramidase domain-containing protein [Bacteroidales bacterium]|nr:ceramidase domain-containing protein [Bacteroidales bacterium]
MINLLFILHKQFINDFGPLYFEFQPDAYIKEPWNAFSSLFFLIPVIYWVWKLRGSYKKYLIITALLPLLFLNGIGSTLYHAFRASNVFLFLDSIPAALMNLLLAGYMWYKLLRNPWKAAGIVALFYVSGIAAMFILHKWFTVGSANIFYFMVGICIFTPTIIYLTKTKFYKWKLLASTVLLLSFALLFRSLDHPSQNFLLEILPMGTHFLWHIFSALAVFTFGYYIWYNICRESGEKDNSSDVKTF